MTTMTEEQYKSICEQLEFEQQKFNERKQDYETKSKGHKISIDALIKIKEAYEANNG